MRKSTKAALLAGLIMLTIFVVPPIVSTIDFHLSPLPTPVVVHNTSRPDPDIYGTTRGAVTVPGFAYIDGMDTAGKVLDVPLVNVWRDLERSGASCQLSHGSRVRLQSTQVVNGLRHFQVSSSNGRCTGWVSEWFVDAQRPAVE